MTKIINLTPHEINIVGHEPILSSGSVRVAETSHVIDEINGIDIIVKKFGKVDGMPKPQPDTVFVVSLMVAQQLTHRDDVLTVGETVRNEAGQVVGAKNFSRLPQNHGRLED